MKNEDKILNPSLYAVLSERFHGEVEVVNPGDEGEVVYVKNGLKYYAHTESSSQEFRVNCPFCGDTRGRLYISYLVGADIKHKGYPVKTYHLMHCLNESCSTIELYKEICACIEKPPKISIPERRNRTRVDLRLPKPNYLINSPKAHAGPVEYMKSRGFDLDVLANDYGVRTCDKVGEVAHLGQMILFPAKDGERLSFWQARMCYDPPKESKAPKYYFPKGTRKSEVVYNRYNALTEEIVVITEGVLDAIRVGKQGVCVFGKHPSTTQTRIMSRAFKRKCGVLMLDADAEADALKWYDKYKGDALFQKGLFLCKLSEGDPASHTHEEVWRAIVESIKGGPS